MCVILHVAAKQTIAKDVLESCYNHNRDGWGIMWAEDGKVHTAKDVSNFDAFYKAWKDVPRHAVRGIHFRIRTHGNINQANCHPFLPRENIGFMHNGFISTPIIDDGMSDTFNFTKYELGPFLDGIEDVFINDPAFKKLMEENTGNSKLLFINGRGESLRCRDSVWVQDAGIWFSNGISLRDRYTSNVSTYSYNAGRSQSSYTPPANTNAGSYYDTKLTKLASHASANASAVSCANASGGINRACAAGPYGDEHSHGMEGAQSDEYWEARFLEDQKKNEIAKQEKDEKTLPQGSDLYSGNRSAEEGQDYLDEIERERQEELAGERTSAFLNCQGDAFANNLPDAEFSEVSDEEVDDDEPELYYDLEQLTEMTFQEMLDVVQDYPRAAAYTLRGLVDTCVQAGIFKVAITQKGLDDVEQEAVTV